MGRFSLDWTETTLECGQDSSRTIPVVHCSSLFVSHVYLRLPNLQTHHTSFAAIVNQGLVQRFTPERAAPLRDLDPLLFQAIHPDLGHFIWYSIQEIDPAGSWVDVLSVVSHKVTDPALELPRDAESVLKIRDMKARAVGFVEPPFSLINDIDETIPVSRSNPGRTFAEC